MVRSDARSPAILAPGTPTAGNITSVGWQVTLCDPIWHVSSRSGVATLRTAIHLLLTYLLTYLSLPAPGTHRLPDRSKAAHEPSAPGTHPDSARMRHAV